MCCSSQCDAGEEVEAGNSAVTIGSCALISLSLSCYLTSGTQSQKRKTVPQIAGLDR